MRTRWRTTATWPNGGKAYFYTEASDLEEAEVVTNFLIQRDYNPEDVELVTEPDTGDHSEFPTTAYYIDGAAVRSTEWTS